MKYKRTRPGSNLLVWSLVAVAYAAAAATLVIETRDPEYRDLSRIGHMTIHAPEDARRLGAAQVAALYRARSGTPFSTLAVHSTRAPPNSTSTLPSACRVKWRVKRTARN